MSKSITQRTAYLKLVFQNIAMANIGDANGIQPSATSGNMYITLYTTDPTISDTGTEADYTGYTRIALVRSALGWTVNGNVCSNASIITFPTSTGVTNTITHFGVRTASTLGDLVGYGSLTSSLLIESGNTPKFNVDDLTITEL